MAKAKKIYVRYGQTVQTIKFENVRLDYGIEVELEEGESWRQQIDEVKQAIKNKLQHDIEEEIKLLTGERSPYGR